jgi:ferredoxin
MTYVVTEECIKCKHMDCVELCPVDCFHEGPNMLVIDPEECIDCTLCVPACPEKAIFADVQLKPEQQQYLQLNAELAQIWPVIDEKGEIPVDAAQWKGKPDKLQYLQR